MWTFHWSLWKWSEEAVGGISLPVGAVVNPTHLLARLQKVENPRRVAALFLHLGVATFDLRLGLCIYVQSLFIWGVHTLILEKVDRVALNESEWDFSRVISVSAYKRLISAHSFPAVSLFLIKDLGQNNAPEALHKWYPHLDTFYTIILMFGVTYRCLCFCMKNIFYNLKLIKNTMWPLLSMTIVGGNSCFLMEQLHRQTEVHHQQTKVQCSSGTACLLMQVQLKKKKLINKKFCCNYVKLKTRLDGHMENKDISKWTQAF